MPARAADLTRRLGDGLDRVMAGNDRTRFAFLIALLGNGHILLEGVPGTGKTLFVRLLATLLGAPFKRIQFTPDLMPADVVGTTVFNPQTAEFSLRRGPIFTSLLLADEINRTPPKTQAALLEAMQEQHVTVAGKTYLLEQPFFVLATQNPIEQEGTYPLPEAQLDRFMFSLKLGYPSFEEEVEILKTTTVDETAELQKVMGAQELIDYQKVIRKIPVPPSVAEYAVRLVQATRPEPKAIPPLAAIHRYIRWGAGPRASQYLALAGKVLAVLDGRYNVAVEDIQRAAYPVLRHRIITNYHAEADKLTTDDLIQRLIAAI